MLELLVAATGAFDVETATRAYLDTLQGPARAKSDAYFEEGLAPLWGTLAGVLVDWLLLRFRIASAIRARRADEQARMDRHRDHCLRLYADRIIRRCHGRSTPDTCARNATICSIGFRRLGGGTGDHRHGAGARALRSRDLRHSAARHAPAVGTAIGLFMLVGSWGRSSLRRCRNIPNRAGRC